MLKRVRKSDHPHEAELVRFFSQQPRASDYRNHVVPLYDVLQWPGDDDIVLLVLPYLVPLRNVRFETMRETLDCIRQLLDVSSFILDTTPRSCVYRVSNSCTSTASRIGEFST